ncbi:MAG: TetR/AcrR family transcriptional regulator [Deltaproteobacteria bacterium]|nr:TetR/AcrR family transcriptional regulator [Deltaproteobacteria bacterium]
MSSSTPRPRPRRRPAAATRPARRERPRGAERRRQILDEAARLFASAGFRGVTTRDVAARVGITEAALYRYFPGKEAIYAAILEERMASADPLAALEEAAAAGRDREVFTGLALLLLRRVEQDPSLLRLLLFSALEGHDMAGPFQEKRIRRLRSFLEEYAKRRQREGAFRGIDPALTARAFIGMVVDHLIVRHVFGQRDAYPQPPEAVAEAYVAIFLDGVRARAGRARRG